MMISYRVIPSIIIPLITLLNLVTVTAAIKCFTCDEEKNITCPGWDRPLVDSETELGDSNNLLSHCVTVVVGEDRVVEQSIMPGSTHCSKIFLESWQILLNSKWNQKVSINCCDKDGCNDRESVYSLGQTLQSSYSPVLLLLTLIYMWSLYFS